MTDERATATRSTSPRVEAVRAGGQIPPTSTGFVGAPDTTQEEKNSSDEKKKFDAPLNFSEPETAPQAIPEQMEYDGEKRGPKTKFYERIAMLERMHDGDTRDWDILEPGMQNYYRREYPEYFGRDNKANREKREQNRVKATRIRHERLQREYRRSTALLSE